MHVTPPFTYYDKNYFEGYANLGVHEDMIKDTVRTNTYRDAIMFHRPSIEGKVVIDVGCGTGILSIFCAQAGAKRVYAIEASDIAMQARLVVETNNLSNIITVLHGRVEDVQITERVDVIVSEWMGYMLLYESMLESVIIARDRWLKHGGLMLPSDATLYMAPVTNIEVYRKSTDFWGDVYGIDMSPIIPLSKKSAFEEPSLEIITSENLLTWPIEIKRLDCHSVTIPQIQSITKEFQLASLFEAPLHGFAFWFDVEFNGPVLEPTPITWVPSTSSVDDHQEEEEEEDSRKRKRGTELSAAPILSTAPEDPETHWKQTLIYLHDPIELEKYQIIKGSLKLSQNEDCARSLDVHLEYASGGQSYVKETSLFLL
ncbi:PREDICTED: probable protein arginine N-methyltransferase 6 [Lupinus angustifolius]|uniref:probable protein arginine N-methyltransferase 6 n=1 Tax=Lupinus angustifolius TaxID=3871 RepID=UPI00092F39E8|nr:PREDICTED: probable protein arginine N-methyltransferase 6 [Lupinus angustifolius]